MPDLPTYADVVAAAARLDGVAHRTPVLRSRFADALLGAEVVFKCESFQRSGAFKFRGAYSALSRFTDAQRRAGVVAFSSGNHAQAIALAAQLLGMPATIVMPHDSPAIKLAATRGYGAEVVSYDRFTEDREAIGRRLAGDRGMTLIPPFDHPDVIAGQGTATRELLEEVGALDYLFAPMGGGGLISGAALAARALAPQCRIYGVEPEAGNDGQQSFRSGAAGCSRGRCSSRRRARRAAGCTASSPRPATTASNRCAPARSFTSRRRPPSPMVRRRNTSVR